MRSQNDVIRIGIIGCGWIVKIAHIPAFLDIPHIQIVAIFDTNTIELASLNKRVRQVKITDNLKEFFSKKIDAVIIGTPNFSHSYYTQEAIMRGIHVLCEKPVGFSQAEIKSLINLSKIRNVIYLPAYVNRYRDDVTWIYEKIQNKTIGEIVSIDAKWLRKNGIPRVGAWNTSRKLSGGGVLQDLGSHIIDLCMYFASETEVEYVQSSIGSVEQHDVKGATWISSDGERYVFDVETWAKAEFQLRNKVQVSIYLDWAANVEGDFTEFTIVGSKGVIKLHTLFGFSTNFARADSKYIEIYCDECKAMIDVTDIEPRKAFGQQANYFVGCIRNNRYSHTNCDCAYHTVNIIESLYKNKFEDTKYNKDKIF